MRTHAFLSGIQSFASWGFLLSFLMQHQPKYLIVRSRRFSWFRGLQLRSCFSWVSKSFFCNFIFLLRIDLLFLNLICVLRKFDVFLDEKIDNILKLQNMLLECSFLSISEPFTKWREHLYQFKWNKKFELSLNPKDINEIRCRDSIVHPFTDDLLCLILAFKAIDDCQKAAVDSVFQ